MVVPAFWVDQKPVPKGGIPQVSRDAAPPLLLACAPGQGTLNGLFVPRTLLSPTQSLTVPQSGLRALVKPPSPCIQPQENHMSFDLGCFVLFFPCLSSSLAFPPQHTHTLFFQSSFPTGSWFMKQGCLRVWSRDM